MPYSDYAVHLLDCEINDSRALGNHVIVVVHGYGSKGEKSQIKSNVKYHCYDLIKEGVIKGYIAGEMWTSGDETCKKILQYAPDVEIRENLMAHNSGISVILI